MAPGWLQGVITRENAESMVKPFEDGKFVVRKHTNAGQFVLCVVYKGKPTHHLMTTDDDDNILINKKKYKETSDIEELITYLGQKRPGWPVPLDKPAGGGGGGGGGTTGTPWLHGSNVAKEDSETLLAAGGTLSPSDDGRFLIRKRADEGQFVLSLVYKGKATQHLIKPNDEGTLVVNNKPYAGKVTAIEDLVSGLAKKPAGWPVKLKEYIDASGSVVAWGSSSGSPAKKGSVKKKGSLKKSGSVRSSQPWLHDKMSNPDAVAKFGGSTTDGTFFVRKHADGIYALSVIYKGKPTHHLLKAPPTGISTVGGKSTGVKGLTKTVEFLREKRAGIWPIPLGDHIDNGKKKSIRKKKAAAEDAAIAEDEAPAAVEDPAAKAAAEKAKEAAEKAAKEAAEAAEAAARQAAAAEDNKVTGFYQLKNPFPKAEATDTGYISVGPGSELLAEARHLARSTASQLSSDTRDKFNVGKPMKVFGLPGASSTDDYEPEEYDLSDGTGTAPTHMSMMTTNPYMAPAGMLGTKGGVEKLAVLQKKVREMQIDRKTSDGRVQTLEDTLQVHNARLTTEVGEGKNRIDMLEKKIALLEQLLISKPTADGEESLIHVTDIRLVNMGAKPTAKQYGAQAAAPSGKPSKGDLARTSLIGKIRLLKDANYADVRRLMSEEFDETEMPSSYKFYTIEDGEADLLMIHQKQESRIPVETSVVYVVANYAAAAAAPKATPFF